MQITLPAPVVGGAFHKYTAIQLAEEFWTSQTKHLERVSHFIPNTIDLTTEYEWNLGV